MNCVSFFSGIGGFDLGFERAGIKIQFQCEKNPFCEKVLKLHWTNTTFKSDINEVTIKDIPNAEIWCGGFPCQDVSLANQGKRKGLSGERSGLFYSFFELAKEAMPEWILLENVPGLLNSNDGEDFRTVIKYLNDIGYCVSWRILDAKYFGTPQRRRRVFILASKNSVASADVLFEAKKTKLTRTQKQSEVNHSERASFFKRTYSIQHAQIGRKPNAGPQGKGYRWDGETYTLDSRGSSDCVYVVDEELHVEKTIGKIDFSNRHRALGNAVAVPIVEWIGNRIVMVNRQNMSHDKISLKDIITSIFDDNCGKNIEMFEKSDLNSSNSGVVYKGEIWHNSTVEHNSEPIIKVIYEILSNSIPENLFLNSEQIDSLINRANVKNHKLPYDLEDALIKQLQHPNDIKFLKVRRMLPIEYERLQGFPDDWTKIEGE